MRLAVKQHASITYAVVDSQHVSTSSIHAVSPSAASLLAFQAGPICHRGSSRGPRRKDERFTAGRIAVTVCSRRRVG